MPSIHTEPLTCSRYQRLPTSPFVVTSAPFPVAARTLAVSHPRRPLVLLSDRSATAHDRWAGRKGIATHREANRLQARHRQKRGMPAWPRRARAEANVGQRGLQSREWSRENWTAPCRSAGPVMTVRRSWCEEYVSRPCCCTYVSEPMLQAKAMWLAGGLEGCAATAPNGVRGRCIIRGSRLASDVHILIAMGVMVEGRQAESVH